MRLRTVVLRALLVVSLIAPLAFGALVHELVPHHHSKNSVIVSDMHSVLRHEDKMLFVLPILTSLFAFIALIFIPPRSRQEFALQALLIRAQHQRSTALRRGVLSYRRFG